jgi:transposase InsO family protein
MNDDSLSSPADIRAYLDGTSKVDLQVSAEQQYSWLAKTLKQTGYFKLRKKDKAPVMEYMRKMTGYSRQHLARLIAQYRKNKWIGNKYPQRNSFTKVYTREDILLLATTDEHHGTLSGAATKKLFERAYLIFGGLAYERLAKISVSHIYNLRRSTTYRRRRIVYNNTNPTSIKIGERRKPFPNNQPGYLRIDTVHQGDKDGEKGVYHINAVDEVTQFEVISSVEKISENWLIPVLENILETFPFKIINCHSDNGSEYINHTVARLLNKLNIQLTKTRPRHSNDNALAESKNGSIIRKHLGYMHIPQQWAPKMNKFNKDYLNPYINYHRPCHFPEIKIDAKGKEKKIYRYKTMMTPYDKLKSLPNAQEYLKLGVTFDKLDKEALRHTDLESAKLMRKARKVLYEEIFNGKVG